MTSHGNTTRKLRGIERHLALRHKKQSKRFNNFRRSFAPTRKVKLNRKDLEKIDKSVSMNVDRLVRGSARLAAKGPTNYSSLAGKKTQVNKIKKEATQKTISLLYPATFGPTSGILRNKVEAAWNKRIRTLASAARNNVNRNESHTLPANLVSALNRSARLSAATHRAPRSANRRHLATIAEGENE